MRLAAGKTRPPSHDVCVGVWDPDSELRTACAHVPLPDMPDSLVVGSRRSECCRDSLHRVDGASFIAMSERARILVEMTMHGLPPRYGVPSYTKAGYVGIPPSHRVSCAGRCRETSIRVLSPEA